MGLHPEYEVSEYWNTDPESAPIYDLVRRNMSLIRWQQLDRLLHTSKPNPGVKETPFQKIEPLNEELRIDVKKYWNPTTHPAVDVAMQRFQGRAKEIVNIPSKPTPQGFKIWLLANAGYIIDLDDYWTEDCGFPATQAVVLDLLLHAGIQTDAGM